MTQFIIFSYIDLNTSFIIGCILITLCNRASPMIYLPWHLLPHRVANSIICLKLSALCSASLMSRESPQPQELQDN